MSGLKRCGQCQPNYAASVKVKAVMPSIEEALVEWITAMATPPRNYNVFRRAVAAAVDKRVSARRNELDNDWSGVTSGGREDPKVSALRATRSRNPRAEAVSDDAFAQSDFLDARDLVQVKYEMVRRVRVDGEPASRAAERFGFSRPSYYAAQSALDQGGLPALVPERPGPRRAHKLSGEVLAFVRERLERDPSLKARDLVVPVAERFGIEVHPRSLERALAREGERPAGRDPKRGQQ